MRNDAPHFRADHVGSLLRPRQVLEAHAAGVQGERLREIEDAAILDALQLQREVGLDVFTDGEYRRSSWSGDFPSAVDGYVPGSPPIAFEWQTQDGPRT